MHVRTLTALALLAGSAAAQAAVSVDSADFSYSQSFDSLATSGSANAWTNDSTLAGWSLFNASGSAIGSYRADTGASNAGAFYSFGTASSSDRALGGTGSGGSYFGSPASGAVAGYIAVAFTNDTGVAVNAFTLGFDGEQWRNGGNTSAQSMALSYGFGSSFGDVTSWTTPGGLFDWSTPVVGATAAAVVGNSQGLVSGLGGTVATAWAPGETLWIRWTEVNDMGNDHGLSIDNVALTVSAVPEPATTALLLAGLAAVGAVARRRA
jgi:hypothetical protein